MTATQPDLFGDTLTDAKNDLQRRLENGDAVTCPCCNQLAKVYRRTINAGAAAGLILFFRRYGHEYGHAPTTEQLGRLGGEFARLALWGLIQEAAEPRPDGGRAGWWRVTDDGAAFTRGRLRVQRYAHIYDGALRGFSGATIDVRECLGDRFDYDKLMAPAPVPSGTMNTPIAG